MNNLPVTTTDCNFYIEQFLKDQDVLETTKLTYKKGLLCFFRWVNKSMITDLTSRVVLNYKQWMMTDKSAYTVNLYLQSLKMFFKWTEKKKVFANIAKDVKRAKTPKGFRRESLTKDQAQELLLSLDNIRDRAMVLLMISTGLRSIEVQRANVEDIVNQGENTLLWIQGKGHVEKDDFCKLAPEVLTEIQEYLKDRKVKIGDPLFVSESRNNLNGRLCVGSISWLIKSHLRNIGINNPKMTCHSLRHTAITFSLLSGSTIQEAQQLARHSSILMTQIYAHNLDKLSSKASEKIIKYMMVALTIGKVVKHRV